MKNRKRIWGWILTILSITTFMALFFVNIPRMSEESVLTVLIFLFTFFTAGMFLLGASYRSIDYTHTDLKNKIVFQILYVTLGFENSFPNEGNGNIVIRIEGSSEIVVNFKTKRRYWEYDEYPPKKGQYWKKEGEMFHLVTDKEKPVNHERGNAT